MIESCVHTHSTFCDGRNTPAEMLEKACSLGLKCYGFSGHSYVDIDGYGMIAERLSGYLGEIKRLKSEYESKIEVLCGLELDSFSNPVSKTDGFDYIIGSAHALLDKYGNYCVVDGKISSFEKAAEVGFGGDYYEMCREYFSQFASFVLKVRPDIIGHFDLITKFNKNAKYYDENSNKYKSVALEAMDAILQIDGIIEVNTGAIARGYKEYPYPARFILERIFEKKGRVIITTDAHNTDMLVGNVGLAEAVLKSVGFKTVCELSAKGFYERKL